MTTAPTVRPTGPSPSPTVGPAAGIPFETSGHTGTPVRWWRTPGQLHDEVRLVAAAGLGTVERVVCFAPPRHLFGRLFGVVLPGLLGVPVVHAWRDPAAVPSLSGGPRTLFVCLPSSWLVLRSLVPATADHPGAVALHGTGPVTATARDLVRDRRGTPFDAVEVFGSTETGAIAVRRLTGTDEPELPWRLLDDVDARIGEDGRLTVRGPRLARPDGADRPLASWPTDDIVTPVPPRSFHWRGRASRMIKVNGIRCDLGVVERAVGSAFPGVEIVCATTGDPVRGERYELFHTGGPDRVDGRAIRAAVTAALPGCPLPAAVHAVGRIARSDTGKPLPHRSPTLRTTTTGTL
ncbi:class I adenylate-forming enzyme family protein [Streptomyces sp. NPDC029216]|uniref:class I adenylate-forming enzyme family protein n=1 Tax=Streptomyces sp. NPDC029216 TaxID=3154701 RepID=UPI0033C33C9A